MSEVDAVLEHFGKKGMKWGVRNTRSASVDLVNKQTGERAQIHYNPKKLKVSPGLQKISGSKSEVKNFQMQVDHHSAKMKAREALAEDFRNAMEARSKHPAHLSNKEMQGLITRMNLERDYKRMIEDSVPQPASKKPSRKVKAAKFVKDLLVEIGQSEVKRVAKGAATQRVNKEAKKHLGLDLGGKKKK